MKSERQGELSGRHAEEEGELETEVEMSYCFEAPAHVQWVLGRGGGVLVVMVRGPAPPRSCRCAARSPRGCKSGLRQKEMTKSEREKERDNGKIEREMRDKRRERERGRREREIV